jgi:uroporphyrin-III C-methyltransferase
MSQDQTPVGKTPETKPAESTVDAAAPAESSDPRRTATTDAHAHTSGINQPLDALRRSSAPTHQQNTSKTKAGAAASKDSEHTGTMTNKSESKKAGSPAATTDSTSAATASGVTPRTAKKANGVWTALFVGLLLVVVALGVGVWWQQQRFETVVQEIASRLRESDQQALQALQQASRAVSIASAQRDTVNRLNRELNVTMNELRTLQQAWEAANEGIDQTLLLNDLKRLINMANQELVLFGNVNSAVSILTSVDGMLEIQTAPVLKSLQQAVVTDLSRLRAVAQIDVANLSTKLESLIQLTAAAPLLSPAGSFNQPSRDGVARQNRDAARSVEPATAANNAPDSATASEPWWSSWDTATTTVGRWASDASAVVLREFSDVMSIRKADDPQALLLSEEQSMQLKANVRAMLLSAQLALMTRQAGIWRSELTEVQSLLNTRYDREAFDTKAALNLLNELLEAPIAQKLPQITDTLSALATAERTLTIPDAVNHSNAQEPQASGETGMSDQTNVADGQAESGAATLSSGAKPPMPAAPLVPNATNQQGS